MFHKLQEGLIKSSNALPWLCHPDARQVSDLPETWLPIPLRSSTFATAGHRPAKRWRMFSASQRLAAYRSGKAAKQSCAWFTGGTPVPLFLRRHTLAPFFRPSSTTYLPEICEG